jgi:hypothetical protein
MMVPVGVTALYLMLARCGQGEGRTDGEAT